MTQKLELIHDVRRAGASLSLDGDRLFAEPADRLSSGLVEQLRAAKPELIHILAGPTQACPHCGGPIVRDQTFDGYHNRTCTQCGQWFRCERIEEKKQSSSQRQGRLTDA